MWGRTVIHDYTWDTKHLVDLCKCVDDIVGIAKVGWDVQLSIRTICLVQGTRSESDLVAIRGKSPSNCLADVWSCSENEDDWRYDRHGFESGRGQSSQLWPSNPKPSSDAYLYRLCAYLSFILLLKHFAAATGVRNLVMRQQYNNLGLRESAGDGHWPIV
jgi:hypothetical protein